MDQGKLIIGLAPTRRDTRDFELSYAHQRKAAVEERILKIAQRLGAKVVNIDFINEEGLMIFPSEARRIAEVFREKQVDAVIVPHVNFGAEEAVALLGKLLGKPLLLWGPRDEEPPACGPRQTDTQCGLFASGTVLDHYNVPFTYLENCWIDSDVLDQGVERFLRVASVVKAFRSMRIGQISVRPRTFLTVKINENELLEKFGIDIVTIDYTEINGEIQNVLAERPAGMLDILGELKETYDVSAMTEEALAKLAAMETAILSLADRYECTCFASECWRTFSVPHGIMPCAGFADLTRRNVPVACECDLQGAISSVLLQAAGMWQTPSFLADLTIRHPKNDNAELLWHCGPAPAGLAGAGITPRMENCLGQFRLKDGDVTVARFGSSHGSYSLFIGEGHTVDGPPTNGNYMWLETKDWPGWEKRLVKGPYIHHISALYGNYGQVLEEACGYLGILADRME